MGREGVAYVQKAGRRKKMVRCRTRFPMVPVTTRPHVLLPWVIVGAVVMFALFGR